VHRRRHVVIRLRVQQKDMANIVARALNRVVSTALTSGACVAVALFASVCCRRMSHDTASHKLAHTTACVRAESCPDLDVIVREASACLRQCSQWPSVAHSTLALLDVVMSNPRSIPHADKLACIDACVSSIRNLPNNAAVLLSACSVLHRLLQASEDVRVVALLWRVLCSVYVMHDCVTIRECVVLHVTWTCRCGSQAVVAGFAKDGSMATCVTVLMNIDAPSFVSAVEADVAAGVLDDETSASAVVCTIADRFVTLLNLVARLQVGEDTLGRQSSLDAIMKGLRAASQVRRCRGVVRAVAP
jgi:hypothetical protein